jgi:hypothetical protein
MTRKPPPSKPKEDPIERRIKFLLGVFILVTTFVYIFISAISQGSDRPLELPDWKYVIPFVMVAFIVVYQSDKADILSLFRILWGGVGKGVVKGISEAIEEEAKKGGESDE